MSIVLAFSYCPDPETERFSLTAILAAAEHTPVYLTVGVERSEVAEKQVSFFETLADALERLAETFLMRTTMTIEVEHRDVYRGNIVIGDLWGHRKRRQAKRWSCVSPPSRMIGWSAFRRSRTFRTKARSLLAPLNSLFVGRNTKILEAKSSFVRKTVERRE